MKKIISVILFVLVFFCLTPIAEASFPIPVFSSCNNPSGELKANYNDGDHAIVGVEGLQKGSDRVYSMGENNYNQCYCSANSANGTQTKWLAAGSISKEDQNVLITQGWVFIQNGSDWGLDNQPYLAKNTSFTCGGDNGGNSEGSSGGSSNGNSAGGSNGSSGGSSGNQNGSVLGISVLAGTSSAYTQYQVILALILGAALIIYGYKIQKRQK